MTTGDRGSPTAMWWCWTENEPSTFRCRERGHEVREFRPGGIVTAEDRSARQSTSARLRQTQRDLVAFQQDLTHVHHQLACAENDRMKAEYERDEARHDLQHATFQLGVERARVAAVHKGCAWKDLAVTAMRERAYARAQLDDAIAAFRADKERS